ncbi:fibronectin type III domain-containing protein [Nocardioides sp. W7]|uniref:fibronectin type III domain-containing protein n=1 Tax=Nocardioides sp. W7 TaxID=2931390 RepID=UPI001FD17BA1|nr:fibronectin type III domain-containing protein [Nocardioides sp. W7]
MLSRLSSSTLLALAALLLGLVLGGPPSPASASASAATAAAPECGCAEAGPYRAPGGLEEPYVGGDGSSAPTAPKYRIEAAGTFPSVALTVRRTSGSAVVATVHTGHTDWGFSPDQERLVTWRVSGPNLEVALYDLTGSRPATPVLVRTVTTGDARIAFSSGGRWLSLTWLVTNTTNQAGIEIVDATSGDTAYTTTFSFFLAPAGKRFGEAGWGFSPDEGRFFHAHTSSAQQVQLALVDLDQEKRTWSTTMTGTGHWAFSPCGTKLAVVEQTSATQMHTRLVDTRTGTVDATRTDPVSGIAFSAAPTGHLATIGGTAHVLAPNPPNDCPDEEAPTWPSGKTLTAGEVGRRSLTLSWSAAVDDRAVTGYRVYRGATLVDTVTARTLKVTGLAADTSYTFRVEAGDAAGNWSTGGPTLQTRTAAGLPTWPDRWVVADRITSSSARLRWPAAADEDEIAGYRILVDGTEVATTDGETRTHRLTGLTANTSYDVRVEAENEIGGVSTTGPARTFITPETTVLEVPEVTGTVYLDANDNGRRDEGEGPATVATGWGYSVVLTRVGGGQEDFSWSDDATGVWIARDVPDGTYWASLAVVDEDIQRTVQSAPRDNQPYLVDVVDGRGVGRVDFGVKPGLLWQTGRSSVHGTVFVDSDLDGVRDAGERGYGETAIQCWSRPHTRTCNLAVAWSDEDGRYHVGDRAPGQYEIATSGMPKDWYATTLEAPVVLGPEESAEHDLGVVQGTSTLTGVLFRDDDADGDRDAGEPTRRGVVCVQYGFGHRTEHCVHPGEDGRWSLVKVPPGHHTFRIIGPGPGWHVTAGTPTTVDVAPESSYDLELGVDGPDGAVAGTFFVDLDLDGARDPGEPGLPRLDYCVTGPAGESCGETSRDRTETTEVDERGDYDRPFLAPGDHTVTLPEGFEATDPDTLTFTLGEDELLHHDVALAPGPPAMPRALDASAGASGSIELRWTAPEHDGGVALSDYVVERALVEDDQLGPWAAVTEPVTTTTGSMVTDLTVGRRYAFRVAAVNDRGRGPWTEPVRETVVGLPTAPTGLSAEPDGPGGVALEWSEPDDLAGGRIRGYLVQHRLPGGDWALIGDDDDETSRLVDGLPGATTQEFRVAALTEGGQGPWNEPASAVVPDSVPTEPRTPGAAATSDGTVVLTWTAPEHPGGPDVVDYLLEHADSAEGPWEPVADEEGDALTHTVTGLAPRSTHHYRVAAVNEIGQGPWSPVATATVPDPVVAPSAPSAPLGLTAGGGVGRASLTWRAPAEDGGAPLTGYVVQQAGGDGPWTTVGTVTSPQLAVTGLAAGTSYRFRVAAVNSAGTGAWSAEARVVPVSPVTRPSAPRGLRADVARGPRGRGVVRLSWRVPAATGGARVSDYVVQRRVGNRWRTVADGRGARVAATVTKVPAGRTSFRVAAVNAAGQGPWATVRARVRR